uniref:Activator 1 subunit 5 n=6 Tax=Amniota TaxID=32524 RepID=A0A8U7N336_CORMO
MVNTSTVLFPQSQNHGMGWVGRDLKGHLVPPPATHRDRRMGRVSPSPLRWDPSGNIVSSSGVPAQEGPGAAGGVQRRRRSSSKGWSPSALEPGWESWGCSPGEEKAPGRAQSPLQGLKGLQQSWRGTGARAGGTGHREWLPTARGQGWMGSWEGIVPWEGGQALAQGAQSSCSCPIPGIAPFRVGRGRDFPDPAGPARTPQTRPAPALSRASRRSRETSQHGAGGQREPAVVRPGAGGYRDTEIKRRELPRGSPSAPFLPRCRVEKYRPQALSELVSHRDILSTVQRFISEDRLPHLLLYGPPGTGKTSTILACARQLYREREFGSMVLELNASDDRGIDIVRGPILSFASTRTIFKKGFKLVILDEADAMTQDAQNALRRVIEKFTENTRFCLICNYLSKIIPALQSRCTRFRFGPLTPELMVPRLQHVIQEEGVDVTEDGMKALVTLSSGDMRRALNILQSTSMAFGKVTEENVYTCTGHPLKSDIANILDWMLNQDFSTAYRQIMELKTLKGLALQDILTEIHLFVHRVDFPPSIRIQLLIKLADIEYRLAAGTSEKIQLSSLIAAFQVTRDLVVAEA